jgi:hypothetical protein
VSECAVRDLPGQRFGLWRMAPERLHQVLHGDPPFSESSLVR